MNTNTHPFFFHNSRLKWTLASGLKKTTLALQSSVLHCTSVYIITPFLHFSFWRLLRHPHYWEFWQLLQDTDEITTCELEAIAKSS